MTFMNSIILYILVGAASGTLAGLLGLGGGVVIVPTLAYIFSQMGISHDHIMHLAIGTSLTTMVFTSFFSTLAHHKYKRVEWQVVKKFVPGIIIGSILGTFLSNQLETKSLTLIFAIYLILISIQMFIKSNSDLNKSTKKSKLKESYPILTLGGMGVGTLSGLLGVGGGTLTVPFLTLLRKKIHNAIGISAASGLFATLFGTISYIGFSLGTPNLPEGSFGFVYLPAVIVIALVSSIFAPLGSKLSGVLSAKVLMRVFSIILLFISIKLLVTYVT
ncbi:MAG: sulfite exporter TauE/SafE family protein [Spirobacillus cienkowskii]|jgi:uncharacterized membrane protein YfcA|uniref:Probable membrane transporter protein n=1 Tax=Spirobacillus cienkowskii TaxID=495820 RepID=A0A369KU94_9BACT|nr:MAG: sulfite exporter TauE/SafE family protein [Spirobacillus cienkowskii]